MTGAFKAALKTKMENENDLLGKVIGMIPWSLLTVAGSDNQFHQPQLCTHPGSTVGTKPYPQMDPTSPATCHFQIACFDAAHHNQIGSDSLRKRQKACAA